MPFLIPAVTALVCDSFIVWLNRLAPSEPLHYSYNDDETNDNYFMNKNSTNGLPYSYNDDETNDNYYVNNSSTNSSLLYMNGTTTTTNSAIDSSNNEIISIYNVNYLAPLSMIRLIIIIIPFLFHSYTGTAIRYMFCYKIFYTVSLLMVIIHMISLALLNPTSMEAIFPNIFHTNSDDYNDSNDAAITILSIASTITSSSLRQLTAFDMTVDNEHTNNYHRFLLSHILELRRIWWMLTLSCISIACHYIILWHVRSTAPSVYFNSYKKRPSVYFAVRTASSYTNNTSAIGTNVHNNNNMTMTSPSSTAAAIMNEQALIHAMNGKGI